MGVVSSMGLMVPPQLPHSSHLSSRDSPLNILCALCVLCGENLPPCGVIELRPMPCGQRAQGQRPDPLPQQAQAGMPHGGRHAADLMIFAFHQLQRDPDIAHIFPEPHGRDAGREVGLRLEHPGATRQSEMPADGEPAFKLG